MRKVMMIITQVLIFTGAYFVMTPDQVVDNTYVFGLFGSHDVVAGNSIWVLLGAAVLSVLNIWVWWPRTQKVINTPSATPITPIAAEGANTKSAEAEKDPVVPKMD